MTGNERGSLHTATAEIQSSLVQARDIIVQLLDGVGTLPQNLTDTTSNPTVTRATYVVSNEQERASNNRAIEEHRHLLGFSGQYIGSTTQSGGKRSRYGGKSAKKTKGATWTHAFVCLSKKSQFSLPSAQEQYKLCAGLSEKIITIEVDGKGFDILYQILLEEFPLLSNAGGIELMRTSIGSKSKTLEVIPVPVGCSNYSIVYLKDVLQQARCYVIQRDLPKQISMEGNNIGTEISEVRFNQIYNTCTQQPLAQGNDLRMQLFALSPLFKKQ